MNFPTFNDYGYPNTMRLDIGLVTLWFSYKTLVAFRVMGGQQHVLDYTYSKTTFKHLNLIDGGKRELRLSKADFQKLYDKEVSKVIKS